jgi:hypothetical protein
MARSSRPRIGLTDSFQRQLNMYSLAAGATAAGMFALAQPAEAKIVYTSVHRVIGRNHTFSLDLNHDHVADFTISNYYNAGTDFGKITLYALPAVGNAVEGVYGPVGTSIASALVSGSRIGPKAPFHGGLMADVGWIATYGKWWNVNNRYLGLRFRVKGKTHYGWARLSVKGDDLNITATLTGYAYETIPNKPILAGRTKGPNVIAKPSTLGGLALGRR